MKKRYLILLLIALPFLIAAGDGWYHALMDASDCDKTAPLDGQVLIWDDTAQLWEAGDITSGSSYNQSLNTTNSPTFVNVNVTDAAYSATDWDANLTVPTKNAIRDKIESLAGGHDAATGSNTTDINITVTGQDFNATINPTLKQTWNEKGTSNFTNTEVRAALLSLIPGIIYNTTTGNFTLNASYYFPLATDKTFWDGKGISNLTDADIDANTNVSYGVTAYGYGDHSAAGYADEANVSTHTSNTTIHVVAQNKTDWDSKQAGDADLTSLAGGVTGIVKGAGNGAGYSAAAAGTDYIAPGGSAASLTSIPLANGTGTVPTASIVSIAGATNVPGANITGGTGGQFTAVANVTNNRHGFDYTITNGTSAITSGWVGFTKIQNTFTLTRTVFNSLDFTKGNATIVVKRCPALAAAIQNITEANFTTAGNFTINGSTTNIDIALTGWTVAWTAGDLLLFNVTEINGFKQIQLTGNNTGI